MFLRKHARTTILLAALVSALTLSAGCGGGTSGGGSGQGAKGPATADQVTIAISGDEGTLTPYTQVTGYPGSNLVALVYDKLLELDARNQPKPLLAKDFKAAPDSSSFTLTMRDGVTWQDGKPFTAQDVAFSVDYYRKYTIADSAPQLQGVKDVQVNGSTVTFQLSSPDPEFPVRVLADMRILPQHIWSTIKDPTKATAAQAIGTGPYKLTSYTKDQGYEFTANPSYAMGKPKIKKISVKVIPQPQTALAGLRTGEVDMFSGTVTEEQAISLKNQRGLAIARGSGFSSTLLAMNNERAPLNDVRVRRAIALAVDNQGLVDRLLRGRGEVGSAGFWHPRAPGGTMIADKYDPKAAAALLDQAGSVAGADGTRTMNGKPMAFSLLVQSSSPTRIRAAELIRDQLKQVGIAVSVQSMDSDSVTAKVWPGYDVSRGRNYDMTMWGWSAPVMLDSTMVPSLVDSDPNQGRLNITGTKVADLDRMSQQLRSATTLPQRRQILGQMQRVIADQVPFVTLYYPEGAYAYRSDVFDGWVYQEGQGLLNKLSYVDLSG